MAEYTAKIAELRQLVNLINQTAATIEAEWTEAAKTPPVKLEGGFELATASMYEARRTMIAAAGHMNQLVADPHIRLIETVGLYWTSTALLIAAEHRIADILEGHDHDGVSAQDIGEEIGIDHSKLERILRTLTTEDIFREVSPSRFANTRTSKFLVKNEGLRSYLVQFGGPAFSAADHLPAYLLDRDRGSSVKVDEAAFHAATGTPLTYFAWLQQRIPKDTGRYNSSNYDPCRGSDSAEDSKSRPEMAVFVNTMKSTATIHGTGPVYDYPWGSLGEATVVDIGGNIGAMCLGLAALYPELKFVIQDTEAGLEKGPSVWEHENKSAIETKRVSFQLHDFFTEQPVKNAEIYWLRYIIGDTANTIYNELRRHDWPDDYGVQILSKIVPAMGPKSRVLICDQLMTTTSGSSEVRRAPEPLPANYGSSNRLMNHMDLYMLSFFNAVERTPSQFKSIIERAGLKVVKIWDCRSMLSIIECALP